MSRGSVLALIAIAGALVLAPAGIDLPGLPMTPRGDEPTYRLMTRSLLADGDLRLEAHDLRRLFEAFPFAASPQLMLVADDHGLRFAPRALYPLFVAPWTALFGSAGAGMANGALLALCLALGTRRASREGGAGALLASGCFVLLSALFVYPWQPRPELLAAALVWTSLHLAWARKPCWRRAAAAGGALGLAASVTPIAGAAALAVALRLARRRAIALPACAAGALLGLGLAAGVDRLVGLSAFGSGDDVRFVATVDHPLALPEAPASATPPPARDSSVLRAAGRLLIGRHAGFLVYFPLAALFAVLAALAARRRRRIPWDGLGLGLAFAVGCAILAWALAGRGPRLDPMGDPVASLLALPGNRLLLPLYPLFFFLVRPPIPLRATVAGGAAAAAILGSLLITPFGMPTAAASTQSHVRSWPIRLLPLEVAWLDALPDYRAREVAGGRLWMRRDETEVRGERVAVLGGIRSDLWLETSAPIADAHFALRNFAVRNRVTVRLGADRSALTFEGTPPGGRRQRLRLAPGAPDRTYGERRFYRFRVGTERGERPIWRAGERADDYVGLELAYLGTGAYLAQDLFAADWLGCGAPARVVAGEAFAAALRLRNASGHTWPDVGAARVRLGARWRTPAGEPARAREGRTELGAPLAPGAELTRWLPLVAPTEPGSYRLVFEPVFENVSWWSDRGAEPCTAEIAVEPAGGD